MKIINLDKFARVQKVTYKGQEYEINGITVDQFLNDKSIAKLDDENTNPKQKIAVMIEVIKSQSNFSLETLKSMPFSVLEALILVSQGQDPDDYTEEKQKSKITQRKQNQKKS